MSDIVYCDERGEYPDCYVPRSVEDPAEGVDVVSWLQAEMLDQLLHAAVHEVDGPAIFGPGNFRIFRVPSSGVWLCTERSETQANRYYVFKYSSYYPEGGMNDCVLRTNDLEAARAEEKRWLEDFHHASIWDVVEEKHLQPLEED